MNGNASLKYKLSYSSTLRVSSKDRKAIEYMMAKIGQSNSMGYYPKGRTGYSIERDGLEYVVTIRKGDEMWPVFVRNREAA